MLVRKHDIFFIFDYKPVNLLFRDKKTENKHQNQKPTDSMM